MVEYLKGCFNNFRHHWQLKMIIFHWHSWNAVREYSMHICPIRKHSWRYKVKGTLLMQINVTSSRNRTQTLLFRKEFFLDGRSINNASLSWFCCKADGPQKFELMFIRHLKQSWTSKKIYGWDYVLDYHNDQNTWIIADLFYSWLLKFNDFIGWEKSC